MICTSVMKSIYQQFLLRRSMMTSFYLAIILLAVPFCIIMLLTKGPASVSDNVSLQQQIAQLKERLRHAKMLSQERLRDITSLRQSFDHVLQTSGIHNRGSSARQNPSVYLGRGTLWQQQHHVVPYSGATSTRKERDFDETLDLQLPSLHHYLPHLLNNFDGLQPAVKIAGSRTGVTMVMGIPTVKRPIESYLIPTLENLIENMDEKEKEDALLIVCIAEIDRDYVKEQTQEIRNRFQKHLDSGLLEVIAPPEGYYPDFNNLRNTLGDTVERVRWRTKQNLDYAYLMMYAQAKGTFYVQLEDDILTKPHYLTIMKNFAFKKLRENKEWIILDFCQLGFIGKMFKAVDLSKLVTFFAIFHNDKPVDWLLDHMIQTKVCRFDRDSKDCRKQKDNVWIHYRPSLFQHVGTHSSLKGKVQKLTDKQFGKTLARYPLRNPKAILRTTLRTYGDHTLSRAYKGETYFWSFMPMKGDNITFHFSPPVLIERYFFRSGCVDHPEDILVNASVQVLPAVTPKFPELIPYPNTSDRFLVVGSFSDTSGVAEGSIIPTVGPVTVLRIHIEEEVDHWVALSEIILEAAPMQALMASVYNISYIFAPPTAKTASGLP
ncbi:alpha-1,3-mannosyl-glycoprotein 4-beta-N-acetylglucosaminyltransferase A-like [Argiope bruennichi]|uniref:alpha-1,3-mannosyl-glycoprotein 4-beta-N-acetylglucosaminyltransferase A-like n=1 Tax=Argiope bruennichi TaxID=94029 RepID=UPI002494B882|nr:alpha-1,3-mannosyl-glycoprotein 4-beta-N-acetylglucosaminyltransferase A-like [Argiope bruennichi]XP_055934092.1 alpha-1,3-mannosyl-glycoprotein 4-beta-N-acetylglucosaminyltransferase A-like [Argiope bruennichi]